MKFKMSPKCQSLMRTITDGQTKSVFKGLLEYPKICVFNIPFNVYTFYVNSVAGFDCENFRLDFFTEIFELLRPLKTPV